MPHKLTLEIERREEVSHNDMAKTEIRRAQCSRGVSVIPFVTESEGQDADQFEGGRERRRGQRKDAITRWTSPSQRAHVTVHYTREERGG